MDRTTAVTLFAGILCMALIATSAGILDAPTEFVGETGTDEVDRENLNPSFNSTTGDRFVNEDTEDAVSPSVCVRPLAGVPGGFVYFTVIFALLVAIARLKTFSIAFLSGYIVMPFAVFTYFFITACPESDAGFEEGSGSSVVGEIAQTSVATPEASPLIIGSIVGLVFLGIVALLYFSSSQEFDVQEAEDEEEEVEPDASDLAAAAGAAVDRIEQADADVDNEVYRAWAEMTTFLDVSNPGSSTPGEFAEAAIDIGLSRPDVEELTQLFEEVRYGGQSASGVREERAVEILRNIETTYGADTDGSEEG